MTRIALGIEYDGSAYCGWQRQGHAPSVQDELERALTRIADHEVQLTAAGRTDTGVHALAQVAHFDTHAVRTEQAWVRGGCSGSAPDISILWARTVPDDFHARFDALSRSYLYRILNRPVRPALERVRACWMRRPLDADAMHAAAQSLVGMHDFSALRSSDCQSPTPIRKLFEISVTRGGDVVEISVRANAFLHHMVRNIAGTLIAVGVGDRPAEWVAGLLVARDRTQAGITAPPQGLYFAGVEYPQALGLPSPPCHSGRLPTRRPGGSP